MRRFLSLLAALALLLAACGGDEASETTTTAAAAADTATTTTAPAETTAAPAATTEAPATTAAPETTTTTEGSVDVGDSPLLSAIANSTEPTSGRMEGSLVMTGVEGMPAGAEFTIGFSGEFDADGNSTMIMDMSDIAAMAPEGELPPGMADLFDEMEIRTIGDTAYMRFGLFSMMGVETEWVSMDAEEAGTTASSFGTTPMDPSDLMSTFGTGISEFEEVGREDVRGVETTHFRAIVDVEEMMAAAGDEALTDLEDYGSLPTEDTPVDFWVGDDGNVYRFSMEFVGTTSADSGFESMVMVWEMFDYGASVEIVAPPADQVTDGSALGVFGTP